MGIIVLKEVNTIFKPICEYCKGQKIPTTIKTHVCRYCNLNLNIMQIIVLRCEYCNGCRYDTMCTLLIFVNPKQVNYKVCIWDYLSFDSYI